MNDRHRQLLKTMLKHAGFRLFRQESSIISPFALPSLQLRHFYSTDPDVKPVKLAYYELEALSKSQKSPVVIMHGLFGSKANWQSLAKVINQNTERKVIVVDARNHGESPHTQEMSYRHLAKDVTELLNDLQIKKSVLIGHSMGGSTMMYTALTYPAVVEKLIVVDMSPIRTSPTLSEMTILFRALHAVKFDKSLSLIQMRKSANDQLAETIPSKTLRQFLLMNLVESPDGIKWRINVPVLEENFRVHIATFPKVGNKRFTGDTLFIGGEESDYLQRKDHEAIKKLFPSAIFTYIADSGHMLHIEKPQEFLAIVTKFING